MDWKDSTIELSTKMELLRGGGETYAPQQCNQICNLILYKIKLSLKSWISDINLRRFILRFGLISHSDLFTALYYQFHNILSYKYYYIILLRFQSVCGSVFLYLLIMFSNMLRGIAINELMHFQNRISPYLLYRVYRMYILFLSLWSHY